MQTGPINFSPINFRTWRSRLALSSFLLSLGGCASLPPFRAALAQQPGDAGVSASRMTQLTYMSIYSYFGYIVPGTPPEVPAVAALPTPQQAPQQPHAWFYVYLWLPASTPELGVRLLSPSYLYKTPQPGDFVEPAFVGHANSPIYFAPWLRLERCQEPPPAGPLSAANLGCTQWEMLADNDGVDELPAQPSGQHHNALVRLSAAPLQPPGEPQATPQGTTLGRGLYRLAVSAQNMGSVHGSFLLQVGLPVAMPGLLLGRQPANLVEAQAWKAQTW